MALLTADECQAHFKCHTLAQRKEMCKNFPPLLQMIMIISGINQIYTDSKQKCSSGNASILEFRLPLQYVKLAADYSSLGHLVTIVPLEQPQLQIQLNRSGDWHCANALGGLVLDGPSEQCPSKCFRSFRPMAKGKGANLQIRMIPSDQRGGICVEYSPIEGIPPMFCAKVKGSCGASIPLFAYYSARRKDQLLSTKKTAAEAEYKQEFGGKPLCYIWPFPSVDIVLPSFDQKENDPEEFGCELLEYAERIGHFLGTSTPQTTPGISTAPPDSQEMMTTPTEEEEEDNYPEESSTAELTETSSSSTFQTESALEEYEEEEYEEGIEEETTEITAETGVKRTVTTTERTSTSRMTRRPVSMKNEHKTSTTRRRSRTTKVAQKRIKMTTTSRSPVELWRILGQVEVELIGKSTAPTMPWTSTPTTMSTASKWTSPTTTNAPNYTIDVLIIASDDGNSTSFLDFLPYDLSHNWRWWILIGALCALLFCCCIISSMLCYMFCMGSGCGLCQCQGLHTNVQQISSQQIPMKRKLTFSGRNN